MHLFSRCKDEVFLSFVKMSEVHRVITVSLWLPDVGVCVCTRAGTSVVWIIGYTHVGQLRSVGVRTTASAGINQGGSVAGNEVQQRVLPGISTCDCVQGAWWVELQLAECVRMWLGELDLKTVKEKWETQATNLHPGSTDVKEKERIHALRPILQAKAPVLRCCFSMEVHGSCLISEFCSFT